MPASASDASASRLPRAGVIVSRLIAGRVRIVHRSGSPIGDVNDSRVRQRRKMGAGADHLVVGMRHDHRNRLGIDRRRSGQGAENVGRRQATCVASNGAQAEPAPA